MRLLAPSRYGAALQGRAVREIPRGNALEILALGMDMVSSDYLWAHADVVTTALQAERERDLVQRLRRDADFRDNVLRRWDYRCAVTGLSVGPNPASRIYGLLEAAHVKPVSSGGPDALENGITLSPTIHRLFDAGLFTIRTDGGLLSIQTSTQLRSEMLLSKQGSHLRVQDGAPLLGPEGASGKLSNEYLMFHQRHVFLKSA